MKIVVLKFLVKIYLLSLVFEDLRYPFYNVINEIMNTFRNKQTFGFPYLLGEVIDGSSLLREIVDLYQLDYMSQALCDLNKEKINFINMHVFNSSRTRLVLDVQCQTDTNLNYYLNASMLLGISYVFTHINTLTHSTCFNVLMF